MLAMISIVFLLTLLLIVIVVAVAIWKIEREDARAWERLWKESQNETKEKNEIKASLDTGNNRTDFEQSVSVLHDLASHSKK